MVDLPDRVLHHLGRAAGTPRSSASCRPDGHARAVRRRAGQGQRAHLVRVAGRGRAPVGGHARDAGEAVAVDGGSAPRADVTTAGRIACPLSADGLDYASHAPPRVSPLAASGCLPALARPSLDPGGGRLDAGVRGRRGRRHHQHARLAAGAGRPSSSRVAWSSLPPVLEGLWLNVRVLVVAEIGILVLGLLIAILRTLRGPVFFPLRALATGYVDLFRGVPLLIALYLIGFGVPALRLQGVPTSVAVLGTITLVLVYSAYVAEVFRAGIESVHPSQRAAARSLGLTHRQSMRLVILPQAVRRVLPPLLNDFVALQKDVGLISVLGAVDAIRAAQIAVRAHVQLHPVRGGRAAVRAARDPDRPDRGRRGSPGGAPQAGPGMSGRPGGAGPGQALRRHDRAARRRPARRRAPGRHADRLVGLGEVDPAALRQPARGDRRRADPPRRRRHLRPAGRRRGRAAPDGDRLPGVQPVSAHDRAAERHARAARGARRRRRGGRGPRPRAAGPGRARGVRRSLPGPAVRRAAAARGDRPCAGGAAPAAAARRDHLGAGPGARRRGAGDRPRAGCERR